jgi:hypothetical protein
MKVAAPSPPLPKTTVDQAQFHKGKDGKKGGPRGQRQWGDRSFNAGSRWSPDNNWQQQSSWSSPSSDTSWAPPLPKGKGWNMGQWQQQPSWPSPSNISTWPPRAKSIKFSATLRTGASTIPTSLVVRQNKNGATITKHMGTPLRLAVKEMDNHLHNKLLVTYHL